METPFQSDSAKTPQEMRGDATRRVALSLLVILTGVGVYFILFRAPQRTATQRTAHLEFGPQEQAYAPNLHVGNFAMKQAENFLNQEVKIVEGDVLNVGDRTVLALDATIEFRDSLNQIALRETRPLLPASPEGLKPGEVAHFEVSFDHVPNSWNYQMPLVTVSGMKLSDNKK
jgi:hypothetical protein